MHYFLIQQGPKRDKHAKKTQKIKSLRKQYGIIFFITTIV